MVVVKLLLPPASTGFRSVVLIGIPIFHDFRSGKLFTAFVKSKKVAGKPPRAFNNADSVREPLGDLLHGGSLQRFPEP